MRRYDDMGAVIEELRVVASMHCSLLQCDEVPVLVGCDYMDCLTIMLLTN